METTTCPECGDVAEILWRTALESTEGPVKHWKVQCLHRHWFFLPSEALRAGYHRRSVATDVQLPATLRIVEPEGARLSRPSACPWGRR